jgi:hypothetical protein
VSAIGGKAGQVLSTGSGPVTTRDIVETLESLPSMPWPARYRATECGGRLLLTVASSSLDGLTVAELKDRFADRGIDARVEVSASQEILRHVRADLAEATFARAAATTGV